MITQAPYHTWLLFNECSRMVQWQQVLDCLFCLFETLFHCLVHVLHNGHVRFFRCQDGPYFPTKSPFFESPFFGSMHFTSQDDTLLDCVFYCVLDEAGSNLAFLFKGDVVLQRPQSGIYTNDVSLLIDGVTTVVELSSQQGEGLQSRHRPLCLHDYPINFVVTFLPWDKVQRVGEASNPGPEHTIEEVNFSLVNPTGLYNKDDLVAALGPGTYSVAETHATTKAQCALKKNFGIASSMWFSVKPCLHTSGKITLRVLLLGLLVYHLFQPDLYLLIILKFFLTLAGYWQHMSALVLTSLFLSSRFMLLRERV